MRIDIATLFPEMCEAYLSESVIGRARQSGAVEIGCRDIRDYAGNKHGRVDDKAYGGGIGMVMRPEPVFSCITDIMKNAQAQNPPKLIYMTPQGKTLTQGLVKELARERWLIILCGRYEGVDCRVIEELGFFEVSAGDYVVTGGELPALILADAVVRLQQGVLPDESAFKDDSHWNGLLEHPLYTRPETWRGRSVPETLLSGHHANIEKWREEEAVRNTGLKRPDLL
ncbi:MAG: tRNA (guanosine(37)-N1)-methyltransferase TrmD [Oscillospiraceae bacterium]|jgi:tRNA (guanine37-N1)-methyltransferase|nr:tRNA (guanosine(37)-N1)-methyltransferase TrmD [Oscillospiraceae bacterium]